MQDDTSQLSLNDETDYGLCFACGPLNSAGLQLEFKRLGGVVKTSFLGREEHQGFPGYVHGGVITAILDEVMSRVALLENKWAITAKLNVRFRKPVSITEPLTAVAEKTRIVRGFLEAKGQISLTNGQVAADAIGTFSYLSSEALTQMSIQYPKLAKEWMRNEPHN